MNRSSNPSRARHTVVALFALGLASAACEEGGPAEADGLPAEADGLPSEADGLTSDPTDLGAPIELVEALPMPLPELPGITCEGRTCANEAGDFVTLAPQTTTVGVGTGLAVESLDDNGTMILRPEGNRTLTERPRAIVSTDPPHVAIVTSMRHLDDGRIELRTQHPEFLGDVYSEINVESHDATMQFDPEGITGPLAEGVEIIDESAADGATPAFPKVKISDGKFSITRGVVTITLSDIDFESAGVMQFYLKTNTIPYQYNYTHATAVSKGILFKMRIVQSLTVTAKVAISIKGTANAISDDQQLETVLWEKKEDIVKVPYVIPVLGPFLFFSGKVGLRFVHELKFEGKAELSSVVRIGRAIDVDVERDARGAFSVKRNYVKDNSATLALEVSGKVTASAGFEIFASFTIYLFDTLKAELALVGKFVAEVKGLVNRTLVGDDESFWALRWVLKLVTDARIELAKGFVKYFFGDDAELEWEFEDWPFGPFFINCGQCASYFGGQCRVLCSETTTCRSKCDCVPSCKDKVCGSNGCGGSCGNCTSGINTTCNTTGTTNAFGAKPGTCYCNPTVFATGSCKSNCGTYHDLKCLAPGSTKTKCDRTTGMCVDPCGENACGVQSDGTNCGQCTGDDECINGLCRDCGTCEGCGGTDACGRACDCTDGQACENGQCVEDCPQGCAPDQYCSAGVCVGCTEDCGPNAYCSQGQCVTCDPGCSSAQYCYRGQCLGCAQDCGRHAYCLHGLCVACAETCAPGSRCVEGACQECDCGAQQCGSDGCEGSCGQCDTAAGQACNQGMCEPCQPQCDDRECGSDGCGSQCGVCGGGFACDEGTGRCEVCTPDCTDKLCGPDGCGGSCGSCDTAAGEACNAGRCLGVPLEETCVSRAAGERCCDSRDDDCRSSSGRCFCDTFCETANDCCPDYDAECSAP